MLRCSVPGSYSDYLIVCSALRGALILEVLVARPVIPGTFFEASFAITVSEGLAIANPLVASGLGKPSVFGGPGYFWRAECVPAAISFASESAATLDINVQATAGGTNPIGGFDVSFVYPKFAVSVARGVLLLNGVSILSGCTPGSMYEAMLRVDSSRESNAYSIGSAVPAFADGYCVIPMFTLLQAPPRNFAIPDEFDDYWTYSVFFECSTGGTATVVSSNHTVVSVR